MTTSKEHLVGQLLMPNGRPQNVEFITKKRPDITSAERAAGIVWVDSRYPPGDVRRYGAVGDGVADDTTAIQNTVLVSIQSGEDVYAPVGTYLTTAPITASGRVKIRGDGFRSTIFKAGGSTDFMDLTAPIEVDRCGFDGYTYVFEFVDSSTQSGFRFTNIEAKNIDRFLFAGESTSVGINNLEMSGCIIDTVADYAVFLDSEDLQDIRIHHNIFKTIGTTGTAVGVQIGGNTIVGIDRTNYDVSHNIFKDIITTHATAETHAIFLFGQEVRVIGNSLESVYNGGTSGGEGIYTKAKWHVVADNTLLDAGKVQGAINIKGQARSESGGVDGFGGAVHDNVVVFSALTSGTIGIAIQNENIHAHDNHVEGASLYGYFLTKPSGVKFHHNTAYGGGGSDNSNPYKGIYVNIAIACDNLEIDYNTIDSSAYSGTGQAVGIDIMNSVATIASSVKVRGNTLKNNTFASGTFRAIQFNASDEDFEDSVITDNQIFEGTVGIQSTGPNDLIRTVLHGNNLAAAVGTDYGFGGSDTFVYPLTGISNETYTPTNVSTDRAFDADTVAIAELADVVGTLVADLKAKGLLD